VQLAATPSPWISLLFGGPGSRNSQARAQRNRHAHMSARNTDDEKGMHRVVRVPPGPGVPETMTTWTHSACCNASLACAQSRFACTPDIRKRSGAAHSMHDASASGPVVSALGVRCGFHLCPLAWFREREGGYAGTAHTSYVQYGATYVSGT
jgi:hypothetical protein